MYCIILDPKLRRKVPAAYNLRSSDTCLASSRSNKRRHNHSWMLKSDVPDKPTQDTKTRKATAAASEDVTALCPLQAVNAS